MLAATAIHVGIIGATAGLVAAILSPLSALAVTWATSKHANELARQERDHSIALARDERVYARRLETYEEAVRLALRMQAASLSLSNPRAGVRFDSFPSSEDIVGIAARIAVVGTTPMYEAYQEFAAASVRIGAVAGPLGPSQERTEEQTAALRSAHAAVVEGVRKVSTIARADLEHG